MINQPQSKVCPRCRFMLSKTYSQKMICKRCGYTTIVAEEDTFNVNIKFSKRVTVKQDKVVEQQTKNEDNLQTYLKAYQAILRHLGSKFISSNVKESLQVRQKTVDTFKNLWFGYLQKMSKQGNPIAGIFTALMEKSQRKQQQKNKATVKAQKQEQSDEGSSQDQDNNRKNQQKQSQRDNNEQSSSKRLSVQQNEQNKQNTKKKQYLAKDDAMREYKKVVNSTLKSIKAIKDNSNNVYTTFKQTLQKQLLQKLLALPRDKLQQSSFSSMTYLSDRYCWVLGLGQCFIQLNSNKNNNNKNNKNKNKKTHQTNKQLLDKKMQMKYVRQQQLRQLCRQRGLSYQKRRLFGEMSILCYDLLEYWYKKENKILSMSIIAVQNTRYPYGYLLQAYKQSPSKPLIIQQLIKLLQTMSQSVLIKQQQLTKKLPQLSLKFITSLIYLSCVINQQAFTILQVINFTLQQLYKYAQQYMASSQDKVKQQILCLLVKEKNMKVKRVKKISHQLFNYLSQYLNGIPLSLNKWCNKYSNKFTLPQHIHNQLLLLTTTLYKSYIQQCTSLSNNSVCTIINNNYLVNNFSQRFVVLQQPQIVLSSLIILMKLNYGLDKSQYPYLINVGQVWGEIQQNKVSMNERQVDKIEFVNKLLDQNQYCKQLFNFNINTKNRQSKQSLTPQSSFGLLKLTHHINLTLQPLNHINQLKFISNKPIKQLTSKINIFKSIITKKQKKQQSSYLSLVYNLNLKHSNNQQLSYINSGLNNNSNKHLVIKYVQKQQQQLQKQQLQQLQKKKQVNVNDYNIIKNNNKNNKNNKKINNFNKIFQLPQLFNDTMLQTRVSLNSNLYRAIDYLQDKYNRFYQYKHKRNQQNQLNRSNLIQNNHNNQVQKILEQQHQHQHSQSVQIINNNNYSNNSNNFIHDQFCIQQYLDRPMAHYQIIYQPTINNLNQLQLKQLLTIVQSLSYSLNGQYTDCSDLLQWLGYLQAVLKQYED